MDFDFFDIFEIDLELENDKVEWSFFFEEFEKFLVINNKVGEEEEEEDFGDLGKIKLRDDKEDEFLDFDEVDKMFFRVVLFLKKKRR